MHLKIISIKTIFGELDEEKIKRVKDNHPQMRGIWVYPQWAKPGGCFCMRWDDEPDTMLRTSEIKEITEAKDRFIVVTRNSVYEFKKVSEEDIR